VKIVHAVRSDGFAGVERHVARLARAQTRAGHDVTVVGGDLVAMHDAVDDARVRLLPARTTVDVARALQAEGRRADVLHVHMTAAEVAATVAGTLRPGSAPVVATRHFASRRGNGRLGPVVAAVARRRVAAQLAISRYVADAVDGPTVVVPPGVEDVPDGPEASGREHVVLMVQRLEPEKRTDLGVRAFAASGLAERGWRLEIAGSGTERAALEALVARLGLTRHVVFLGARRDVGALMTRAGLLVAPCPIEGLGLSVLEAMASGLPVVAAGAGGHVETLGGLDPAALYPPLDPGAAGLRLAELAASPRRRDVLASAARDRQRARFTPAAQVAATDAVYRHVVERAR
jgi:glycosyltransferase involved in cell wall biosynthesis